MKKQKIIGLIVMVVCGMLFLGALAYAQDEGQGPIRPMQAELLDAPPTNTLNAEHVQTAAIMPHPEYEHWQVLRNEYLNLKPTFDHNQEWKDNLQSIADLLHEVDAIFRELKDSQAEIMSNQEMARNFAQILDRNRELIERKMRHLESMEYNTRETDLVNLQSALSRKQQVVKLLSGILVKINETRNAIIRNLG